MHGITKIDRIDGIEKEWHGLTNVREQSQLNTFEGSALDWPIEWQPLFYENGAPATEMTVSSLGEDSRQLRGLVSGENLLNASFETYGVIPNAELWELTRVLIDEYGFNVASIGSVYGRKQVFWTLECDDLAFDIGGHDKTKFRVNLASSHDKTITTQVFTSAIRIVCANTLRFSLNQAKRDAKQGEGLNVRLRKSRKVLDRIPDAKAQVLEWANEKLMLQELMGDLDGQKVTKDEALQFSAALVSNNGKLSTRSLNIATDISERFESGIGNKGESRYDLLNGVTEKFTRDASNTPAKAFLSSEFGAGSKIKAEAFEMLIDDSLLEQMIKKGEQLLNEFEESKAEKETATA